MQQYPPNVTLVLGGVRSGKSRYAQNLGTSAGRVTFVATAERRDDAEMIAKIERHRAERPDTWTTIEEPLNLARTIQDAGDDCDLLLIDCLTLFAANLLEACNGDPAKLQENIEALCRALSDAPCSVVLVSNEVGSGVVPAYELGRRFRDLVGEINQRVAAVADTVLLLVAGLPLVLKGSMPAGVKPVKGLFIGGTASGVGKTTVTLAIISAVRQRGLIVQPFKGGPDFLDTGHHTRIAGRRARNIDTWMLSADANRDVLRQASRGADAVIVEGMMGLFDGKDGATEVGSSAEIAKLLGLPVVLVLDAGKSARSMAAVVMGFELFDPALCLGGVILNQVASDNHFKMLQAAIRSACKTPVLGWLPRESAIAIPGRHLGLQTAEEFEDSAKTEQQIDTLAALAEKHFDLDALLEFECGLDFESLPANYINKPASIRIGVARDRAFSFYYEDNLDLLREQGAEIVEFSPLVGATLPDNLDALYLGGGYPELHAEQLSSNRSMHSAIREFANSERPIYAECGGMIYLSRQLTTIDGSVHAMAAALPFSVEMTSKLVQFGYVTIELTQDCLLGTAGTVLRGHSFHYSRIADKGAVSTSSRIRYSLSGKEEDEGYTFGNTLASYIHVHFRTFPPIANTFVELARSVRARELATT